MNTEHKCEKCGHKFDDATSVLGDEDKPLPGSFSICIECGSIGKFRNDLSVRILSAAELEQLRTLNNKFYRDLTIVSTSAKIAWAEGHKAMN